MNANQDSRTQFDGSWSSKPFGYRRLMSVDTVKPHRAMFAATSSVRRLGCGVGLTAGFTMVELLITVAMISALTAIALPTVRDALRRIRLPAAPTRWPGR